MNNGSLTDSAEPLLEALTRREREVLAYQAEGLTSSEIAGRLTLAVSSVRWHVRQIYGKLGVNSKRQALARARELGLLPQGTSNTTGLSGPNSTASAVEPLIPTRPVTLPAAAQHNLPAQRTALIGRAHEVKQVQELLAQARLVTLTGAGGVGKTRLSLQTAETVVDHFEDGVWYVELASLTDPARVPQQAAAALKVREVPDQPILDSLASFLRSRQVLLVLDNCEHVLDACAHLVDHLLNASQHLKVLTSSREPLGVTGEAIYRVPSLSFPAVGKAFSPEEAVEYAAVRLFVIRALLARPDFQVTAENAVPLARICQRLEGIPLAIELAAARTGMLTLEEVASRLDDAFRLLTGGSRSALPRQQTLRATIDWSYQLLGEKERLLFQRLAVFGGGCTLEAAEAICSGEGLEASEVLDLLASLVVKSMVLVDFPKDADSGATRYRLLETVRQYAREKLQGSGEHPGLQSRHREYYQAYIETNAPRLHTREQPIWFRKLEAEHDNLRLALDRSFSDLTQLGAGLKLVLAMNPFWSFRYFLEPLERFIRGVALSQGHNEISPVLYSQFLGAGAHRMSYSDPQTAQAWLIQSIEITRRLGPAGEGMLAERLLDLAGRIMWDSNDYRPAIAPLAEAEALLQRLEPESFPMLRVMAAAWRANLANLQGNYRDGIVFARESIQMNEKSGLFNFIWEHIFLGDAFTGLGEYKEARESYLEALRQVDKLGDMLRRPFVFYHLGVVDLYEGNLEGTLVYARAGLQQASMIPDVNLIAMCLGLAARALAKKGEHGQAARLSGAAHTLHERKGRLSWEESALEAILPGWEGRQERDAIRQAYEEGRAMNVEQAVEFALKS